jgi:hypothetical protein
MIGRTRPEIRDRQPRVEYQLARGRYWLLAGIAVCATAIADPPAPAPRTPAPAAASGTPQPPAQGATDDDFIEFLGRDDVGDTAWWEFLKKAPPRVENPPPVPPPQEAKR